MTKKNRKKQKQKSTHALGNTNRGGQHSVLKTKYKECTEKLSQAEGREEVERFLKNEAYSFLLAEGLIDKFLEYRDSQQTQKHGAIYFLVTITNLGGLWIDV